MTKETTMMTGDEVNRSCTHIAGATIGACPDCVDIALKEARREERERMAFVWEALHGYDKHGLAKWLRALSESEKSHG